MYVQVDATKKLRKLYTAITLKNMNIKEQNAQLNTYNEFDL